MSRASEPAAGPRRYAEVWVNLAAQRIDRSFHYLIPPQLQNKTDYGQIVKVPFGHRTIHGVIVGFPEKPGAEKLKPLDSLVDEQPFLYQDQIDLAHWLADRYLCQLTQALRAILPPGVWSGDSRPKYEQVLELNVSQTELKVALDQLEGRAPKQYQVLRMLASETVPLTQAKAARRCHTSASTVRRLIDKELLIRKKKRIWRQPDLPEPDESTSVSPVLHERQHQAVEWVQRRLNEEGSHETGDPPVLLLHGVTGSGKTEVYIRMIEHMLEAGRQSLLLIPEISLTPQTTKRVAARFGSKVLLWHSGLSQGERHDVWRQIQYGEAGIVVGARSAVFLPFTDLGGIIIDEEHAGAYKQEVTPRYHAREVARYRCQCHGAVLVLGSATPSVESFYMSEQEHPDRFSRISLPERATGAPLPGVEIVDMREEMKRGNRSVFSRSLRQKIQRRLDQGQQVLLFLNRRGYATFVLCRHCGWVISCPVCDIPLTYHFDRQRLHCHHCNHQQGAPQQCPRCSQDKIRYFGTGTEKIEREVQRLFPNARAVRMDSDTTRRKGSQESIYEQMSDREADILIGTQMVAKGLDLPGISLVGVVAADTALHLPDYRSTERTFQLLTQVAGRAGRQGPGQVVVQTYTPDHYSIRAAAAHDYQCFYEEEMKARRLLDDPPLTRIVRILVRGREESLTARGAGLLADTLRGEAERAQHERSEQERPAADQVTVLGPAEAPFPRLRGYCRWHVLLKGHDGPRLRTLIRRALGSSQPLAAGSLRISVDVDPMSVL